MIVATGDGPLWDTFFVNDSFFSPIANNDYHLHKHDMEKEKYALLYDGLYKHQI